MASAVAELDAGLQGMLALKPPGVSGSRIANITALCVANVQVSSLHSALPQGDHSCIRIVELTRSPFPQSESLLIQKLFTHFKKTPGTHKLGVLYVVDSVTRKWLDQAKAQGQTPSLAAPDGTFAAGVHRVTELIPILMNDIIATAPEDQKVRKDRTKCHFISTSTTCEAYTRGDVPRPCTAAVRRQRTSGLCLLRARLARVPRTRTFLSFMMDGHSQGCLRVGEDKEACRYLGKGPNIPSFHGQLVQRETECSANHEYVLSPTCCSHFRRASLFRAARYGVCPAAQCSNRTPVNRRVNDASWQPSAQPAGLAWVRQQAGGGAKLCNSKHLGCAGQHRAAKCDVGAE